MATPPIYILRPATNGCSATHYGTFEGPVNLQLLPQRLPKGSLVAVRPPSGSHWPDVQKGIETVAVRVVNAPLALWPDCVGKRAAVQMASAARLFSVRCVVWTPEPTTDTLRPQLTDLTDWPMAVVWWARRRGFNVTPDAAALMEVLAAQGLRHRTIAGAAAHCGVSESRWRRVLKNSRLGPLSGWYRVLRAVGIALEVQRVPDLRIADLAFRLDFSGAQALSDRLNDIIGARPRYIRKHLGSQWMLADGFRRQGNLPTRG